MTEDRCALPDPSVWRRLVDGDPCGVFILDADGQIVAWNPAADRMLGGLGAAALGRAFSEMEISYRVPKLHALVEDVRRGLASAQLPEVAVACPGGPLLVARITVFRAGATSGVIVRVEDRTTEIDVQTRLALAEKELEATRLDLQAAAEELESSNEELRESNEELSRRLYELEAAQQADHHKNQFLAMLAHELRNPLAPILSAMQIIRQQASEDPIAQRAREIVERQVRHQARLLDDLLDVSRITRGKVELRQQPLGLGSVVADALEATRSLAEARRHVVTTSIPEEPIIVEGDATRLTQVVANLLSNAAKYTPAGGTIGVTVAREGDEAVLRVRDTGVGIPAAMLSDIFDLFTQVNPSLARSEGGLGIGLTLVRSLVELHGGTVVARSEGPGRGAEFVVRLPLAPAGSAATLGQAAPPPAAPFRSRCILVIEDNTDTREMLRTALELDGHRVSTADDGRDGVEVALAERPEVILIDLGLPGLDGYEVAKHLRAALGPGVLLIALTGYGQPEDRRRSREAGFDAHLVKPVPPEELARILAA